jgi:hypothetical protein
MSLTAKRLPLLLAGLIVNCLLLLPSAGQAASSKYPKIATANFPAGTVKKTFKVPLAIKPGQNLNYSSRVRGSVTIKVNRSATYVCQLHNGMKLKVAAR